MYTRSFWNSTQPGRVVLVRIVRWGCITPRLSLLRRNSKKAEGCVCRKWKAKSMGTIVCQCGRLSDFYSEVCCSNQHLKQPQGRHKKSRYIPVDPVTTVRCVRRRNCLSILCMGNFSVLKNCQDPVVLLSSGYRWLLVHPKVKRAGPDAVHLHIMTISRMRGVIPPPPKTLDRVYYYADFKLWRRRTGGRFTLCFQKGRVITAGWCCGALWLLRRPILRAVKNCRCEI